MTQSNRNIYRDLIIGALLHDIGKVFISDESNHNLHVYNLDDEKRKELEDLLTNLGLNENDIIYHAILYHHKIDESAYKKLLSYISVADNIASDVRSEENEDKELEWKLKIVYPLALFLKDRKKMYIKNLYGIIDLKKKIEEYLNNKSQFDFLVEENDLPELPEYRNVWKEEYQEKLKEELREALKIRDPDLILAILYKYLYFYPEVSSPNTTNYFSLAFHLKTTAMLTDLLYKRKEENKDLYLISIETVGTHQFILFTLKKKKEFEEESEYLKKINATSEFIDILTALITKIILKLTNSYNTNIIFLSGSEAKIVVGLNRNDKEKIEQIIKKLNKILFEFTLGNLYLIVDFKRLDFSNDVDILNNLVNLAFGNNNNLKELEEKKIKKRIELVSEWENTYLKNERELGKYLNEYIKLLKSIIKLLGEPEKDILLGREDIIEEMLRDINSIDNNSNDLKEIISNIVIVSFESIIEDRWQEILKGYEDRDKIFIYLRGGRVKGKPIDEFERIGKTKTIAAIKIDGDKVGDLFGKLFKEYLYRNSKILNINEKYAPLILLRVSDILSFMFKYAIIELASFKTKEESFVSIIYNSGDELAAIGDLQSIMEFYREFLDIKRLLLLDILKTSSALIYTHYKYPLYFIYKAVSEGVEKAKKNKPYQKLEKYKNNPTLENYLDLEDSLYLAGTNIALGEERKKTLFNHLQELYNKYLSSEESIPRSRIANMIELLNRSILELEKKKMKSIIYLVYYIARTRVKKDNNKELPQVFVDLLYDIKEKVTITDDPRKIEEIKNTIKYWIAVLDYIYTITREES